MCCLIEINSWFIFYGCLQKIGGKLPPKWMVYNSWKSLFFNGLDDLGGKRAVLGNIQEKVTARGTSKQLVQDTWRMGSHRRTC